MTTMTTNILKSALLAASFLTAVGSASAETIHANIPFEFIANGTTMPAGSYTVRAITSGAPVLLFENDATKAKAMAFARTANSTGKTTAGFTLKTAGYTYELSGTSKSSMKALLALTTAK